MWEDILKARKFYASKVDSLINEVFTGKLRGGNVNNLKRDFKKIRQLLADKDLTVRFHVEIEVKGGEFTGLFTIAAKTYMEFLTKLTNNLEGKKIPELGREFNFERYYQNIFN